MTLFKNFKHTHQFWRAIPGRSNYMEQIIQFWGALPGRSNYIEQKLSWRDVFPHL